MHRLCGEVPQFERVAYGEGEVAVHAKGGHHVRNRLVLGIFAGFCLTAVLTGPGCGKEVTGTERTPQIGAERSVQSPQADELVTVFMSGDVMTGRGIDQVLPHPADPVIYESFMNDARGYVLLAEKANGPIDKPVDFAYIWGDALAELERVDPDVRIINLETSVTSSDAYWEGKGINYRMAPQNVPCLTAAKIDVCSLANNHVLDWGYAGLAETLVTLRAAGIHAPGAGQDLQEAEAPAVIEVDGRGRVVVFAYGSPTSGVLASWAASADQPGVNLLESFSDEAVERVKRSVDAVTRQGDVVVVSVHWGSNWGYAIPLEHIAFAHQLIDEAGVDVIHGHSSHHVRGIEVYNGRLVLYGCGDFLNDYEGISGYEEYRGDLTLMYFASLDPRTGELVHLRMTPMQTKYLRANLASQADVLWLAQILNREGEKLGTRVEVNEEKTLTLRW